MKKTLKWAAGIIIAILAVLGIVLVALIIRYYPLIDRVYIRPCHYYPQAFIDCQ